MPPGRLEQPVVAGQRRHRPGLAEAGDRAVDQPRVDRLQALVIEPEALEVADLVVLDQHVGGLDQLADDLLPLGLGMVERDRALVAVGDGEEARMAGLDAVLALDPREAIAAPVVAHAGPFDLDHVRAQIAEDLRADRRREDAAHVDHADAGEGRAVRCSAGGGLFSCAHNFAPSARCCCWGTVLAGSGLATRGIVPLQSTAHLDARPIAGYRCPRQVDRAEEAGMQVAIITGAGSGIGLAHREAAARGGHGDRRRRPRYRQAGARSKPRSAIRHGSPRSRST